MHWQPFVHLQQEPAECGLVALAMAAALAGRHIDIGRLKSDGYYSSRGLKPSSLCEIAHMLRLSATPVALQTAFAEMRIEPGTIVLLRSGHYVVVGRKLRQDISVFDPVSGWKRLPYPMLLDQMTGLGLEVKATRHDVPCRYRRGPSGGLIRWLLSNDRSWRTAFWPIVISLLALAGLLISPQYAGNVIDGAISEESIDSVALGAVAVAAALFFSALAGGLASVVTARSAKLIECALSEEIVGALFKKPLAYFGRQPATSLATRLESMGDLHELFLEVSTDILLKIAIGVLAFAIVFAKVPELAVLSLSFGIVGVGIDRLLQRRRLAAAEENIVAIQAWRVLTIEMIGAVQALRLGNALKPALERLKVTHGRATETTERIARQDAAFGLLQATVEAIATATVLLVGAILLASGGLSMGEYVASVAYLGMVASGLSSARRALSVGQRARAAEGRIQEFVDESSDSTVSKEIAIHEDTPIEFSLRDVSFSYSRFDTPVFANLNLEIERGEHVAIIAPSGFGKSTLARLLAGALTPTAGIISAATDGGVRRQVATVMQDDTLITGSIAENIAFYRSATKEEVERVARMAGINEDIESMEMGFNTRIGDSFRSLSGGQRQRILLARALLGSPDVLILDEATSALDAETERSILARIGSIAVTRVVFTHRQESIRAADRIIDLRSIASRCVNCSVAA